MTTQIGKRAALYLNIVHRAEEDMVKKAQAYCTEYGYHLDKLHIYQDTNALQPALIWLKDAMEHFEIHVVLLPSLSHIHKHLGPILNFLQDAQECQVEVIFLDPVPTPLNAFGLALLPLTVLGGTAESESLVDIVHCLRFR